MKILFGVQCTGNGHISRSREIVRELKTLGHSVLCVLSGRDPAELREMEVFEPYVVYSGLSLVTSHGKVRPVRSLFHNSILRMYRDVASFDARGFDVVVCDFEPVTARVAKKRGIPSIGVGHQYAFVFDVPVANNDIAAYYVLRNMARTDYPLGLHWHHFGHPILPPIVPDYLELHRTVPDKILVYLPFEERADVDAVLNAVDSAGEFFIYGAGNSASDRGRMHYRAFSRAGFLGDLADCDGVICNAGFELPSEALHLGKRLLVKPLRGQLEQRSNAMALEQLSLGHSMATLDPGVVSEWLETAPNLMPANYPRTAVAMARWIDRGHWEDAGALARDLWTGVTSHEQMAQMSAREHQRTGA